jgi:hypothetical protein
MVHRLTGVVGAVLVIPPIASRHLSRRAPSGDHDALKWWRRHIPPTRFTGGESARLIVINLDWQPHSAGTDQNPPAELLNTDGRSMLANRRAIGWL